MNLGISENNKVVVMSVDGSILQDNIALFQNRLSELMENGQIRIVIDMHGSTYISSMGLAAIIEAKLQLERKNGDIRLACVNTLIRNLLETTQLIKKLSVFDSIEDAVKSFE